jgi:hypothetical protein
MLTKPKIELMPILRKFQNTDQWFKFFEEYVKGNRERFSEDDPIASILSFNDDKITASFVERGLVAKDPIDQVLENLNKENESKATDAQPLIGLPNSINALQILRPEKMDPDERRTPFQVKLDLEKYQEGERFKRFATRFAERMMVFDIPEDKWSSNSNQVYH